MQHLLLLHGAIGSKDQLQPLANVLQENFIIHTIDFSGHGGSAIPEAPFSIDLFATQALEYLDQNNVAEVNIFGYSMGGYVALYLAKHHPNKLKKIITLGTKFYWDETIAAKEIKMLDPEIIQQKIPAFATQLKERHAPADWKGVLKKTRDLLEGLGNNSPLKSRHYLDILIPCLLLLGDRDKMITLEETIAIHKQLPNAQLGILPATPHPIEQMDIGLLAFFIKRFL